MVHAWYAALTETASVIVNLIGFFQICIHPVFCILHTALLVMASCADRFHRTACDTLSAGAMREVETVFIDVMVRSHAR